MRAKSRRLLGIHFVDGGAKQLETSLDQALVHLALALSTGSGLGTGQEWRPP